MRPTLRKGCLSPTVVAAGEEDQQPSDTSNK
jgi:hypothetical protein